jgi:hypothetical protein
LEDVNLAFSAPGMGLNMVRSEYVSFWPVTKKEVESVNNWGWNWSPDGSRLAYSDEPDSITILDMSTGYLTKVKQSGNFDWHPNSRHLAIANNDQLFLANSEDGMIVDQISLTAFGWSMVSFAPDGGKLAYLGSVLYIVDLEVDESQQLIKFGNSKEISSKAYESGITNINRVAWSPKGDRLAVTVANWPNDPYVATISTEGVLRARYQLQGGWMQNFSWSPSGNYLALEFNSLYQNPAIYVANDKGSGFVKISETAGSICTSWTMDDRLVYSPVKLDARTEIIVTDAAGIQKQVLPVSERIMGDMISICAKPRPGIVFSAVVIPTSTPDPMCTSWPRLKIGEYASVIDDEPNRVRSAPQKGDNLIATLAPGSVFLVLEGPICADGLVFWKVESDQIPGKYGWTAEGDGKEYWLAPSKP